MSKNFPLKEQRATVVHDVEEAGVEVALKPEGQALKMSASDVGHMLSRAHIKAQALENLSATHLGCIQNFVNMIQSQNRSSRPDMVIARGSA